MNKSKQMVAYLPNLDSGGAQKQTLLMLDFFSTQGFRATVVVDQAIGSMAKSLPSSIEVVSLRASRTLFAIPRLAAWLRRERPDVLLSCLGHNNIAAIIARFLARTHTTLAISQHNVLTAETKALACWQHGLLPLMYRAVGAYADAIIAVSQGVARDMSYATGLPLKRISVIPNPVIYDHFASDAEQNVSHRWLDDPTLSVFVAVGRLVPQKDFITLLTAFARVRATTRARLLIVGEGSERLAIEQQIAELDIANEVELLGYCSNPLPYMAKADALVLSSRYEGFGNVIVESLACGTSVVSTDCPYGPSEILADGKYGRLVKIGDPEGMAQAMLEMLQRPFPPSLLRARAAEFSVEAIGRKYINLFSEVSSLSTLHDAKTDFTQSE
jgi:glycosyltransferase involved in cell wall biosynthesis